MQTSDFDYDLPPSRIAQEPAPVRDKCRLLVLDAQTGLLTDRIFKDILDYFAPGDVVVANNTRVLPARLLGTKRNTGGNAEVFLLKERFDLEKKQAKSALWEVLVRPGKRLKPGAIVDFTAEDGSIALSAEICDWVGAHEESESLEPQSKGGRIARLSTSLASLDEALHKVGHTPLPPYIKDYAGDEEMYQTVYSKRESSAAAPTAGLHFTDELIEQLKQKGVQWHTVELEVGLDTFRIVEEEDFRNHVMHTETFSVDQSVVDAINAAHERGNKVVAVGTTSVRSLESAYIQGGNALQACKKASTNLFITPGYNFGVVDAIITNFHVPRSTLMMLVSAFASRDYIMAAYTHAIEHEYRMLSFGDAMFIHKDL
ncbi:MAG: tRNA preQ1(34) S-adenosylmethionine ribosyltransferase-isomerase QueA [Eggerthellaceae bacterium]|nr:tRNA preQ1(34) S-adenosylmethionine ribosyltransferase-isomerase QueA [Eggerthellaceae bacterium]